MGFGCAIKQLQAAAAWSRAASELAALGWCEELGALLPAAPASSVLCLLAQLLSCPSA